MKEKLGVGVVCSSVGRNYAQAFKNLPDLFEVVVKTGQAHQGSNITLIESFDSRTNWKASLNCSRGNA